MKRLTSGGPAGLKIVEVGPRIRLIRVRVDAVQDFTAGYPAYNV